MVKTKYIKELATKLDITIKQARAMFDIIGEMNVKAVERGEDIPVPHLGKIIVTKSKPREFYSYVTKRNEVSKEKTILKFKTSGHIKTM